MLLKPCPACKFRIWWILHTTCQPWSKLRGRGGLCSTPNMRMCGTGPEDGGPHRYGAMVQQRRWIIHVRQDVLGTMYPHFLVLQIFLHHRTTHMWSSNFVTENRSPGCFSVGMNVFTLALFPCLESLGRSLDHHCHCLLCFGGVKPRQVKRKPYETLATELRRETWSKWVPTLLEDFRGKQVGDTIWCFEGRFVHNNWRSIWAFSYKM